MLDMWHFHRPEGGPGRWEVSDCRYVWALWRGHCGGSGCTVLGSGCGPRARTALHRTASRSFSFPPFTCTPLADKHEARKLEMASSRANARPVRHKQVAVPACHVCGCKPGTGHLCSQHAQTQRTCARLHRVLLQGKAGLTVEAHRCGLCKASTCPAGRVVAGGGHLEVSCFCGLCEHITPVVWPTTMCAPGTAPAGPKRFQPNQVRQVLLRPHVAAVPVLQGMPHVTPGAAALAELCNVSRAAVPPWRARHRLALHARYSCGEGGGIRSCRLVAWSMPHP